MLENEGQKIILIYKVSLPSPDFLPTPGGSNVLGRGEVVGVGFEGLRFS